MSLLTTFGLLFESDAGDAEKDLDKLDKKINDTEESSIEAASSFDELSQSVDESGDSFVDLAGTLTTAAAGLVLVTGLFAGITSEALNTDEVGKFSETMGYAIEDVGAWGETVKRQGGSAESFRASLTGINDQLTDISLTGGGEAAEVFARLGIEAVNAEGGIKSAFDVLPELADSFEKLSKTESVGFGKKLGLDQGTILLLQQGRVSVEALVARQKQMGVATEENYIAAAEFNDAMADSSQSMKNMFASAGTTVLPLLTTMLKGFGTVSDWIMENKTLVTGFFIGIAGALTAIYLPAISSVAAATLAATWPFIAVGAAVAALGIAFALLYEDVVAYLGGQQSFIGDLAKEYEWFGKLVEGVISGVKFAFAELSEFGSAMVENIKSGLDLLSAAFTYVFGGVDSEIGGLGLSMNDLVDTLLQSFSIIGAGLSAWLGFIASPIETIKGMFNDLLSIIPDIGKEFDEAFAGIKSFFGWGDDEIEANLEKSVKITTEVDNNPLNGQTSASIVNSQQQSNTTNQVSVAGTTINTQATDAAGVATAVNSTLSDQVTNAIAQTADGVAY